MSENTSPYEIWKEFLARWPVEKLESMTLEEYAMGNNDKTSFCYWIERGKAGPLGGISGGNAYKWQIIRKTPTESYDGRPQDDTYVWWSENFHTSEEAFNETKKAILTIVASVQRGDLSILDQSTVLWPMVMRKIAFLYQKRDAPQIFPVYLKDWLDAEIEGGKEQPISKLYGAVMEKYSGKDVFEIADLLSAKYDPKDENGRSLRGRSEDLGFRIWKISHGRDYFSPEDYEQCLNENVISTGKDGGDFASKAIEGDVVYVCQASEKISLLGVIAPEPVFKRPSQKDERDWNARHIIPLKRSILDKPYEPEEGHARQGGMPDVFRTFSQVAKRNYDYFEQAILKPYFGLTLKELMEMRNAVLEGRAQPVVQAKSPYQRLLESSHNLIFTGAPGTGKTHLAKEIASQMILGKSFATRDTWSKEEKEAFERRCCFVQFHPSFDYTDFVEGLRPFNEGDGKVGFERKDGHFKEFCKRALETEVAQDNFEEVYQTFKDDCEDGEQVILKTIDRQKPFEITFNSQGSCIGIPKTGGNNRMVMTRELLRHYLQTGEVLNYRSYVPAVGNYLRDKYGYQKGMRIVTTNDPSTNEPFVLIIDEINRGDLSKIFGELFFAIDPGYRGRAGKIKTQYQNMINDPADPFAEGFYIPENVYIIGTMNDIDRSVESMDFAIRRRFTWKKIRPSDTLGMLDDLGDKAPIARRCLEALNGIIASEESPLTEDYAIGPAYFRKVKDLQPEEGQTVWSLLWENHLEPLLAEYLRGRGERDELLDKLRKAYEHAVTQMDDSISED